MPDIYYAPTGMWMLIGYYFILAVPLLLVVPFSTFRSLASEREDGTFELLSISTLTSRQIVTGKLASAILQMIVYYSALAPCIAFTYMLRGVDLITIAMLLFYTFLVSLILCSIGLVFAGVSKTRSWQSMVSVVLLLGLVLHGFMWASIVAQILDQYSTSDIPVNSWEFWALQGAWLTAGLTYIALFVQVAASQNSFASDNRSTRIRVVLSVQTILFLSWITYFWLQWGEEGLLVFALVCGGLHWLVYACILTGESGSYQEADGRARPEGFFGRMLKVSKWSIWSGETAHLSPRIRRELPQSFLGRIFFTWYNPGSGTGFVFAIAHLALICGFVVLAVYVQQTMAFPAARYIRSGTFRLVTSTALITMGYFVSYLGVTRLLILLVPNREKYGLVLPFLLHVLVLLAGSALPFTYESWQSRFRPFSYSPMQITNWFWAYGRTLDGNPIPGPLVTLILAFAGFVLLANLLVLRREVQAVRRIATPERVLQEGRSVAVDGPAEEPLDPFRA